MTVYQIYLQLAERQNYPDGENKWKDFHGIVNLTL